MNEPEHQLIYVMPEEALQALVRDSVSLVDVSSEIWDRKFLIISITIIFAIASIAYALTATEWYRAEVVLVPAEERSSPNLSGTLGGLATIAGVSVGGGDDITSLATMQSNDFARQFILNHGLLPVLLADGEIGGDSALDVRDAVKNFVDNVRVISRDRETGLVTLSVYWTSPELAAEWANSYVSDLNSYMRRAALEEAETNLAYLESQLSSTSVVGLQQSIGRLMESELQKLMLAKGSEEFSFEVIDRAQVPKVRARPQRTVLVIIGTLVGGMFAVALVMLQLGIRRLPLRSGRESRGQ